MFVNFYHGDTPYFYEAPFQRALEIGISGISCKTTLNDCYGIMKIIIRKTQTFLT